MVRLALRSLAALLAAAVLLSLAAPAHADAAAPVVLLLHGGGWQGGDPSSMNAWRDDFEAHGYQTRMIAYPLGSVTRSIEYVDAIAQVERRAGVPVIAYGISAGGTIAAALAATGRVDGAVDVVGPTDFTRWLSPVGLQVMLATRMSAAEKRSASPYWRLNGRQAPQLLQCGLADPVTTYEQCTRYVSAAEQGNPDTTLQPLINLHSQWPADRARARAWVQARWPVTISSEPVATTVARPPAAPRRTITRKDDGRIITIAKGARLTISLENNATTDRPWRFKRSPSKAILRLVADRTAAPRPADSPKTRTPQVRTIVYKALKRGRTKLKLQYVRRSQTGGDSLAVTVKVR